MILDKEATGLIWGEVINGGTSNRLGVREREAETRSAVFPRKDKTLKAY